MPRFGPPESLPSPSAVPLAFVLWVWQAALSERDRWPLWLPVAFGTGIGIYFALPVEPMPLIGIALGASGILLAFAAALTEFPAARALQGIAAAILVGFAVAKHRTDSVAAPVIWHRVGPIVIDGRVENAQVHGKGVRVVLMVARAGRIREGRVPRRVRVSIRTGGEMLKPGDWIEIRAVLLPPPTPAAPGDYDFGRAAFFRQIGAVGYAYGRPVPITPRFRPSWTDRVATAVGLLRWRVSARIHSVLPGSTGAIAAALITGDRGGISEDDEGALRDAGLAHVLAIAGLHMALVGLGLFWAVRATLALFPQIALTQPIKKWAAVAALGGAAFYLLISGAATPAMRAFIMLAVMLIAILVERPALSMRAVALAAFIVLALQPETLVEPGFQMSFAAVVSLIAVAEWERTRKHSEAGPRRLVTLRHYIRGIATTSFVGSIATAPYAIFHFDRATHFAVLGNLGAMPIMGFVTMPAAALSVILMPFGLDEYPLRVMGWGIEAMLAVGQWVSGLPESVSLVSAWPIEALVLMTFGGLWISLWHGRWRWFGMVPALAALVAILAAKPADVLVARDGMTIAVRGADGLLRFVRKPDDKYSAEQWLKRDGDERSPGDAIARPADGVRCDAYGCIARAANETRIAAVMTLDALEEDCAANQIVISAVPVRGRCIGPQIVIDRFAVARNGAYAIWLNSGAAKVQTARQVRGNRPWGAPPSRTRAQSLAGALRSHTRD